MKSLRKNLFICLILAAIAFLSAGLISTLNFDSNTATTAYAYDNDKPYEVKVWGYWNSKPSKSHEGKFTIYNQNGEVETMVTRTNYSTSKSYDSVTMSSCPQNTNFYMKNNRYTAKTIYCGYELYFRGVQIASGSGEQYFATITIPKQFEKTFNTGVTAYWITWKNGSSTIKTDSVVKDYAPIYSGATPTKAADAQYTYSFSGWSPTVANATANVTYTAQYSKTVNTYKITWKNYDGTTLKTESVAYGTTPTYTGETPVKPATAQITYTFAGWTPAVTSVTGAATYTATFTESARKYDVCFINFDGTVLKNYSLEYGETPEYDGDIPVKPATEQKSFTFNGWDKEIATVTGDQTYSATYSEIYNASVSLSLGGEIVVNFYIYLPYYTADENAYFTLTYNHNKTSYSTERTTDTVSINELEQRADGRYKISCGLASAQICDLIDLRLFDGSDNLLYSKTDYSIRDYCNAVIDGGYNEDLVSLCKSIMNYGGYAQIQFGYNVDDVANAEKDYASDIESVNAEDIKEEKNIEEGATDFALTGDITLMALDKSAIRFYFDLENEEDLSDYEISVSEGFKVRTGENNVGKYIAVYNILSINYSKAFTVTVKNISDLTETTITYSVLDNIKAKLMGNASVNTKNLSKAMYLFGLASSAFFGN